MWNQKMNSREELIPLYPFIYSKSVCCLIIHTKNYLFKVLDVCIIADRIETSNSRVQSDNDPKFKGKAVLVFVWWVLFCSWKIPT